MTILTLQDLDLRIIIALFTPHRDLARKVWCEVSGGASKLDPLGHNYIHGLGCSCAFSINDIHVGVFAFLKWHCVV